MAEKENSVERAKRLIKELDEDIQLLRNEETSIRHKIEEINKQITSLMNKISGYEGELEYVQDHKIDKLCTKMALQQFVKNGGGLDMLVE